MAVFKANYTRQGRDAKASIRYIETRPGHGKEKTNRPLFGVDGIMTRKEAYRLINEAEKGSLFFRFIISPDPSNEDSNRDLDLRGITSQTMLALDEKIQRPIQWVAAEHTDHSPNRHTHVVAALPKGTRLEEKDLELLRLEATNACLDQRQQLDHVQGITRARSAQYTRTAGYHPKQPRGRNTPHAGVINTFSGSSPKRLLTRQYKTCLCFNCGYRQLKTLALEKQNCLNCGKEIKISRGISITKEVTWGR